VVSWTEASWRFRRNVSPGAGRSIRFIDAPIVRSRRFFTRASYVVPRRGTFDRRKWNLDPTAPYAGTQGRDN